MQRANCGRWYAIPFRIEPERGQVSENVSKPPSKQSCDVFHDDVSGSNLANKTPEFTPQSGAFTSESCAFPCEANVLAWESTADDIYRLHAGERFSAQGTYVIKNWDIGPMLSQNCSAVGIDFAERDGAHSCSFESETEPSDAAE